MSLTFSTQSLSGPAESCLFETLWGYAAVVARENVLIRVFLPNSSLKNLKNAIKSSFPESLQNDPLLPTLTSAIKTYFSGQKTDFSCVVDISWARPFGQTVLRSCCDVRSGHTITYGQLAQQSGRPKASRAAGSILAANPTPLVIPCHRVVAANGSLGGYSAWGGIETKRRLLTMEKG